MSGVLTQRAILIVEDEILVAECLAMLVEDEGGTVVGPAASVAQAVRCLGTEAVDAAILDVNLRDSDVTPLVPSLRERQIPFMIHTGGILPARLRTVIGAAPIVTKPAAAATILAALGALLAPPRAAPAPSTPVCGVEAGLLCRRSEAAAEQG